MPRISVVIPTFNRGDLFYECVRSVMTSIGKDDEIIVVNDSKTTQINPDLEGVRIFDNPKSGVASARNFGASKASGEYLLFIDDDMIINADAVEACYQLILQKPGSAINSDWIYPPDQVEKGLATSFGRYLKRINFISLEGWCSNLAWVENDVVIANGVTSQFLLLSRNLFERTGGYNEAFHFAGFEDYDFGKRLEKSDTAFIINTQCVVFHNETDRMDLLPFLERKKRGAFTRKEAVLLGYPELRIPYSGLQTFYYRVLSFLSPVILFIAKLIPNKKSFDKIYSRLLNRLIGIYIFKGYRGKN